MAYHSRRQVPGRSGYLGRPPTAITNDAAVCWYQKHPESVPDTRNQTRFLYKLYYNCQQCHLISQLWRVRYPGFLPVAIGALDRMLVHKRRQRVEIRHIFAPQLRPVPAYPEAVILAPCSNERHLDT
eukprot:1529424-Rhodomonas_salina.1